MLKNRKTEVIGFGTYVPEKVLTNKDLEKIVDTTDEWISTRTGISERRIASENEATSDLAYNASLKAIKEAKIDAEEIDLIIVATVTSDHLFPSTSALIQKRLNARNAAAFDINAACSGFTYGMVIADNFIKSGTYKKILVVGGETLSRIVNWEDRNTCVLFGDAAAAAVLSCSEFNGILGYHLSASGDDNGYLIVPNGGSRSPLTKENILKRDHFLKMNGQEVFRFAVKALPEAAKKALENSNLTIKDIDYIVPHQANIRIIQAAAKKLNFPMDKFILNLDKYGNTSSASIGLALQEALESGKIKKGSTVLLVGFGAGLTSASVIIRWNY